MFLNKNFFLKYSNDEIAKTAIEHSFRTHIIQNLVNNP